jgi:hypothetical protein
MATMFDPTKGFMPTQMPEMFELNRQRKLADLLTSTGMQTPQGQMVGGVYVPTSPFEYIGNIAKIYAGSKIGEDIEKKQIDLAEALRKGKEQETRAIIERLSPRDVQTEMAGPYTGNVPMPVATQTMPPDIQGAMNLALQSQYGAGKELLPTLIQRSLPEPIKPTTEMQNYEYAKSQGYKGTLNDFRNQITPYQQAQLSLDRERFELEKQNKALGKDLTEAQGKASAFQSQMISASNVAKNLESSGFDPTSLKSQTAVRLAGGVANPAIPVTAQQYKQAQDQWSEAYLRFKTGAAATEQEVQRNNKTFFPVFGDKPNQVAQKAEMREQAEKDVGIAAGRGAGLGAQPITPTAPLAPMFAVNPQTGARIQSMDGGKTWNPAPKR